MAADLAATKENLTLQGQDLGGKIALVTGATKGIGRAVALNLASRGAAILGTCTSAQSAHLFETLAHDINSLYTSSSTQGTNAQNLTAPKLVGIAADITSHNAPDLILDALAKHFDGKIDIVVLNAAVMAFAGPTGSGMTTEAFLDRSLAGNIKFPVLLMEGLVQRQYLRKCSRVVAVSSVGSRIKRPSGGAVYSATKAALECLIRKWADELGGSPGLEGSTFNSVSVGLTKTDAYNNIPVEFRERIAAADAADVAVGDRVGEVEDVADVVGLLVSEKARWISGSVVDASGGQAKIL